MDGTYAFTSADIVQCHNDNMPCDSFTDCPSYQSFCCDL